MKTSSCFLDCRFCASGIWDMVHLVCHSPVTFGSNVHVWFLHLSRCFSLSILDGCGKCVNVCLWINLLAVRTVWQSLPHPSRIERENTETEQTHMHIWPKCQAYAHQWTMSAYSEAKTTNRKQDDVFIRRQPATDDNIPQHWPRGKNTSQYTQMDPAH